ncbi:MAG: GTPase domain-containing protein [Alkalimonas sp.]|nr:GTPase domain-containing protein [Alkalimonas sp.]
MNEPAFDEVTKKIKKLSAAIEHLYLDMDRGTEAKLLCHDALEDCENAKDRLGISKPIIAIIGEKNSGKSAFCQSFIIDSNKKEQIKSGLGNGNATVKVQWIGAEKPKKLNVNHEVWNYVNSDELKNLGKEYVLVDVPGFNDISDEAQIAAKSILKYVSVVILMANWDSGLELDSVSHYLRLAQGAYIIPFINDAQIISRPKSEGQDEILRYKNRLNKLLGEKNVANPVYVGKWTAMPSDKQNEAKEKAEEAFEVALRSAIQNYPITGHAVYFRRYEQLKASLESLLHDEINNVSNAYNVLLEEERNTVSELAKALTGKQQHFEKGLRIRLLTAVADNCSRKYFPFKSFLNILAITSGAWGRLTMTLAGSIPSLAMVIFQTGKNIKSLTSIKKDLRVSLSELMDSTLKTRLSEGNINFFKRVHKQSLDEKIRLDTDTITIINASDIYDIELTVNSMIEDNISKNLDKMVSLNVIAIAAMAVWIFLAIGPVISIYGSYIAANISSISSLGSNAMNFPNPGFSTILFSIILIFFPVLLLAMMALGITVNRKLIKTITYDVTNGIESYFTNTINSSIRTSDNQILVLRRNVSLILNELTVDKTKHKGSI